MSRIICQLLLSLLSTFPLVAAEVQTALGALRALPPEEGERLARIDGCEGSPSPQRWHFLVYNPQTENGYREYVVADHHVVAKREVSQFGGDFQSTDIVGNNLRVDSDRAARLARRYAVANNLPVASMNYELRRGMQAGPVWEITCFDENNQAIAWLIVSAEDESVLSQTGFSKTPVEAEESGPIARPSQRPRKGKTSQMPGAVAENHEAPAPAGENREAPPRVAENREAPARVAEKPETSEPVEIRRAEPIEPRPSPRKPFRLFRDLFRDD
jgi:hypothetical protein